MLPGLLMFLFAQSAFVLAAPEPFWKSKEKVYDRVKAGEIIVGVKSRTVKEPGQPPNLMTIAGGGQVDTPAAFVFKRAVDFDQVSKISGYIKSAKFNPETEILELWVGAFGFDGKMKLRMKIKAEDVPKNIEFTVLEGAMKGLRGTFLFSAIAPRKTEVGIESDFRYDQFPAPQIFLEFGLEVAFQRMAARLKAHVEEEFRKGNKQ